jgi:signal recognition particle subunit SEC65
MSELVPLGSSLARRESRAVTRELARIEGRSAVEIARITQAADLQAERVSGIAYVGKRALHEMAMVSQLEVQLSNLVPAASARLQGIADLTALAAAEVVGDTVRKVR